MGVNHCIKALLCFDGRFRINFRQTHLACAKQGDKDISCWFVGGGILFERNPYRRDDLHHSHLFVEE